MQPGTYWYIGGTLVVALGSIIGGIMIWKATLVNSEHRDKISSKQFKAIVMNQENRILRDFSGIQIIEEKLDNTDKGYIRIKIHTGYLNSKFAIPVTLKNSYDKFQPIAVLCDSDAKRGPGIFIILPNRQFRTVFYFTDFLQFKNLGNLVYVEDFVFDVFYNERAVYFVTIDGAIKFEPTEETATKFLGTVKVGPNLITRPYDGKNYMPAIKKFPDLAMHFHKDYSDALPDLYR